MIWRTETYDFVRFRESGVFFVKVVETFIVPGVREGCRCGEYQLFFHKIEEFFAKNNRIGFCGEGLECACGTLPDTHFVRQTENATG